MGDDIARFSPILRDFQVIFLTYRHSQVVHTDRTGFQPEGDTEGMSDDRHTTGQVEVMLLGTYHMANPGHDLINVDADSPLDPTRQTQLETCTDRLADWEPDRIAVEYPHDKQIPLNDLYDRFNAGSLKLDGSTPLPDPFADGFIENEIIQLGFRLAIRCGHTHVLAIDHEAHTPAWTDDGAIATMLTRLPAPDDVPYHLPDPTEIQETQQTNLEEHSIGTFIAWCNTTDQLRINHDLMFASCFESDDIDPAVGMLTRWYERNLRMLYTTLTESKEDDHRILVIVGSGHVRVLAHLIEEAPNARLVTPEPYLPDVSSRSH